MRQKALLFDFDGVIADTEGEYSRFWDKRPAHDPAPRLRHSPLPFRTRSIRRRLEQSPIQILRRIALPAATTETTATKAATTPERAMTTQTLASLTRGIVDTGIKDSIREHI